MPRTIARALSHHRIKWVVLAVWIGLLVFGGMYGTKLTEAQNNETASWLPGDAESTQALEALEEFQSPDALTAVIVYERAGGTTPADMQAAASDAQEFSGFDGVTGEALGPFPSDDGEALQTVVTFDLGPDGWELAPEIADDMHEISDASAPDGLDMYVTGPLGNAADSAEAFAGIDGMLLVAALSVVIVLLLLTYRSPVLWILPIFSAVSGLLVAQGLIYLLAEHAGLTVNGQSAGILTVLVIGAGTDYALLLVARYREELRLHEDRHEAMAEALYRAGPAILASGGTVILGMLCLLAATMNSTQGLGPVAAIGVAVALVAMVTLLPALLVICGRWVFWPVRPQYGTAEPTATGIWARTGQAIAPRARIVWVTTTVLLGAAWLGLVSLDANGLTQAEGFRGEPESIQGAEVVDAHYDSDAGNTAQVIGPATAAADIQATVADTEGVEPAGEPAVVGDRVLVEATLTDPAGSGAANDTIDRLRSGLDQVGEDVLVGGFTAINLDVQRASQDDNRVVIPLIMLVVLVILGVLLRAIVAAVVLMLTVVLSFGAALGLSALAFEHIFGFGGTDSAFPLFVFVFLVALGIDYNIFLMTRVREEALDHGTRRGALIGLSATGGVITSAGLVLAATFAVLATLPLTFLTELGFAVALGVLLDTIVVRSVLVTALNLDLGRVMWWPSALWHKRDDGDPLADSQLPPTHTPAGV
ncbi:MAG: Multidrug efflux transporter AcrB [Nocardioidaceae bacterium]|nr:Multidrug efflux transporter AcrB [Nocardioidaceae bacterium]